MSDGFPRTLRGLEGDGFGHTVVALTIGAVLLVAWSAWLFLARVAVHEVSATARIEMERAAHPIEAPGAGRVVTSTLVVGREVEAGEVLVELATEPERLGVEESRLRTGALAPQLDALHEELAHAQQALEQERRVGKTVLAEARAKHDEAAVAAAHAEQAYERAKRLHDTELLSDADLEQAQAEAERRRAAAEGLRLAAERVPPELRAKERDRSARIEQLRREIARVEGEIGAGAAAAGRLERAVEEKSIRSPVRGSVIEAAPIEAGAYVREGDRLGVILGSGALQAVADFAPEAALGRIRVGQPARVRLAGFPSSQYGSLEARVARVSSELRDGTIRVELTLRTESNPTLPLQHGLPGDVEVEVERVSPAILLLRAAGTLVSVPRRS